MNYPSENKDIKISKPSEEKISRDSKTGQFKEIPPCTPIPDSFPGKVEKGATSSSNPPLRKIKK